ncbi:cytochrome P450 2J2-like [Megalops cyprinoides]|uniref:cytochrome P450 2J2-like n=1 Tax=Megalops cyprinoides TaxID=118141 RepID=UPI001864F251|nr:cytochrome P450 2J2-like [Megalops cyprinoides]
MLLYSLLEGLDIQGLLLFLLAFLLITDFLKYRNPPNFPPGPWALPFVGNVFHIDNKQPHIYLTKLANVYGNVFSLRLGREKTVLVTGYKMVKEALVTQAETFVDRPPSPLADRIYSGNGKSLNGIFLSNGYRWKKQRRFALTTLRNFGLGKKSLESVICEESRFLQEEIEREKGRPFDPHMLLNNVVSNIICVMVFGHRFDYNDHNFNILLKLLSHAIQLEGSIWGQLYEAFPTVMKYLPGPHNDIFTHYKELSAFVREELEKHKEDWDPSDPRDYIDAFLTEIQNNKGDPAAGFEEANLILCSLDLFLAGTETTSTTLRWALLYMMKYPDIKEKVQAEIDRVIGQSRQPTMADRANMPYTDAVIHEIQRMGNIVPLNGPRMVNKDTTLGGYFLPKGTSVLTILTSVMFDKTEWQTPDTFNPGHFLDSDGKFVRRDAFLPFSAGKRICLGEQLARMELFLFFVFLFQKFSFSPPEGEELDLEGQAGTTLTPLPFKICVTPR